MAQLLSQNPANIAGLFNKGSIAEGKQADLMIWDPQGIEDEKDLRICNPILNPFFSTCMQAKVIKTYLRGQLVYDGENFEASGRILLSK